MGEALGRGVKGGELGGRVEVRVKSKDLTQPFWFNSHRVCSCHSVVQRLASMVAGSKKVAVTKVKKQTGTRLKKGDVKAYMTLTVRGNPCVAVKPQRPGVILTPAQVRKIGRRVVEKYLDEGRTKKATAPKCCRGDADQAIQTPRSPRCFREVPAASSSEKSSEKSSDDSSSDDSSSDDSRPVPTRALRAP